MSRSARGYDSEIPWIAEMLSARCCSMLAWSSPWRSWACWSSPALTTSPEDRSREAPTSSAPPRRSPSWFPSSGGGAFRSGCWSPVASRTSSIAGRVLSRSVPSTPPSSSPSTRGCVRGPARRRPGPVARRYRDRRLLPVGRLDRAALPSRRSRSCSSLRSRSPSSGEPCTSGAATKKRSRSERDGWRQNMMDEPAWPFRRSVPGSTGSSTTSGHTRSVSSSSRPERRRRCSISRRSSPDRPSPGSNGPGDRRSPRCVASSPATTLRCPPPASHRFPGSGICRIWSMDSGGPGCRWSWRWPVRWTTCPRTSACRRTGSCSRRSPTRCRTVVPGSRLASTYGGWTATC